MKSEGVAGRLARELGSIVGSSARGTRAVHVAGYRGFGTRSEIFVSGRVLLGQPLPPASDTDPWWRNLAGIYRRMESDEVPGARVRIRMDDATREAVSGEEGYFRAWIRPTEPLDANRLWHPLELTVVSDAASPATKTHALTPSPTAAFGVISDLDDTVVRTDATSFVRMMRGVLFSNARTRLPFEGVAAFYHALHRGAHEDGANPIFYVSSSPWNLYDTLIEFLEHRGIPMGPLLLRDWGLGRHARPTGHRSHKTDAIRQILDMYPHMQFLLIGDSGQQDPEIYADIVAAYPRRIMGIYIRDVTGHAARRTSIEALASHVHQAGSVLVLAEDTIAAARHAAERGWMSEDAVAGVRAEATRDHGPGRPPQEHDPVVID